MAFKTGRYFLVALILYVPIFQMKHKHVFTFYVIPLHWYDMQEVFNPSSSKTVHVVNIMAADALVTQGARASANMKLT